MLVKLEGIEIDEMAQAYLNDKFKFDCNPTVTEVVLTEGRGNDAAVHIYCQLGDS